MCDASKTESRQITHFEIALVDDKPQWVVRFYVGNDTKCALCGTKIFLFCGHCPAQIERRGIEAAVRADSLKMTYGIVAVARFKGRSSTEIIQLLGKDSAGGDLRFIDSFETFIGVTCFEGEIDQ